MLYTSTCILGPLPYASNRIQQIDSKVNVSKHKTNHKVFCEQYTISL